MIGAKRSTAGNLDEMLSVVMKLPRPWVWLMLALTAISCVSVDHPADRGWGLQFEVTALTIGALALIWLPALLRLLSVAGGKVKAAGLEASSGGLLGTPEGLIEDLAEMRTDTERASREVSQQAPDAGIVFEGLAERIDAMAEHYLSRSNALSLDAVEQLAEAYERIRSTTRPGDRRTLEMTRVVNEARVRANADRDAASRLAKTLLRSDREGERIVGLAMLQEATNVRLADDVLQRIASSASAFEMFNALLALREMATRLSTEKRDAAIAILETEKTDPRGVKVMKDPSLPPLIDEVLTVLGEDNVWRQRWG